MCVSEQFIVCLEIFDNKQAAEFRSHFSLAISVVYSIILFIPLIIILAEFRTKNGLKEEVKKKGAESGNARYRRQHIWTPLLSPTYHMLFKAP